MLGLFAQRWLRSATDVGVLLLVLHLPLALLFSFPSRLLYLTAWEIWQDTALLMLIYAAAAAAIGLLIAVIATMLQPVGRRVAEGWIALATFVVLGLVLLAMAPMVKAWWTASTALLIGRWGLGLPVRAAKYAILALAGLAVVRRIWRSGPIDAAQGLSRSLAQARIPVTMALVAAGALALASGHLQRRPFGWRDAPPAATAGATTTPNVILITIDALSAGEMSLYGYSLPTTPDIDRFAQSAYVFDNFFANSNFTTPAVVALLTGRYPVSSRVFQLHGRVRPGEQALNLATLLKAQGYQTAAIVANYHAHPFHNHLSSGFDFIARPPMDMPGQSLLEVFTFVNASAFSLLVDWWWGPAMDKLIPHVPLESLQRQVWYPPSLVIAQAERVLETNARPLFLWTHFMPPHDPYLPPPPFLGQFLQGGDYDTLAKQKLGHPRRLFFDTPDAPPEGIRKIRLRYDEHVAYVDHEIGLYLDYLERNGWLANSIVVIMADHGESFEKGFNGHGGPMLHQALVHVPLIVRLPGMAGGARVTSNAEQVDLLPTVLDALGMPTPPWADGESLLPFIRDGGRTARPKFSVSLERSSSFAAPARGTVAVIDGDHKLVHYLGSGCEEFYDLAQDPHERRSLAAAGGSDVARLRRLAALHLGTALPLELAAAHPASDCSNPFAD